MKKLLFLLLGILLGIAGVYLSYHSFHNLHITAIFNELEPFPRNLNVYYKGFKLGRTVSVHPSKDFTQTHVEMVLNAKNLKLPDNTTAKMKAKNKKDYIELDYPAAPSITYLKNHSYIEGKKSVDIGDYIDKQAEGGGLDEIKENLNDTVESAGETLDALTGLFKTANDILLDLRPALKQTGDNLVVTTSNLAEVSKSLNRSAKAETLDNTFINIEAITRNLELTTSNTALLTQRTDKETVTLINCLIKNANLVVMNINDIVKGFKATLSQKFAGMRLIFGTPIKS